VAYCSATLGSKSVDFPSLIEKALLMTTKPVVCTWCKSFAQQGKVFFACLGYLSAKERLKETKYSHILTEVVDGKAKVCLSFVTREGEGERRAC
jgi:hypothetical protein